MVSYIAYTGALPVYASNMKGKVMKKSVGAILSAVMLFSCIPVNAAQTADITISSADVKIKEGTVSIKGETTVGAGDKWVSISVTDINTDENDIASIAENLQNAAMVKTNAWGRFEYNFDINYHSSTDVENYTVKAVLANNGASDDTKISCIGSDAYEYIKNNAIIMSDKCRNVFVYGDKVTADNEPFMENGTAYADAAFLADAIGADFSLADGGFKISGDNFTIDAEDNGSVKVNGNYVQVNNCILRNNISFIDIKVLENIGKYVYIGNNVFAAADCKISGDIDVYFGNFGVYVSCDGDDGGSGRANAPVKSFERALELTEQYDGFEYNTIYVMGGDYFLKNSIEIDNKKDLTIENYANQKVALKGSIKLDSSDFTKADAANLPANMSSDVKSKLVQLDLSKYINVQSARELGYNNYYRLYENKTAAMPARYPNAEYTAECVKVGETYADGFMLGERVAKWDNPDNAWIGGMIFTPYFFDRAFISKNSDNSFIMENDRYDASDANVVFYNIFEELDMPGEWFIDAESGMLYLYPTGNLENVELTVLNAPIMSIKKSENIVVRGIEIGRNNNTAVEIGSSENIAIDETTISGVGGYGVDITDSSNAVVKNSEIYDIAMGGVRIDDKCGNIGKHIAGNCGVENCHIYNFSDENSNKPGVEFGGIGNFVKNNVIHDSMSQGVLVYDFDNVVENNEIYNVVRNIYDGGAIYSGGFGFMGIEIKNNYIHDIFKSYRGWGGVYGIYADNAASGITLENNIVTQKSLYGGGRNNTIRNNIFIDGTVEYDTRALLGNWYRKYINLQPQVTRKSGFDEETWYAEHPELKEMTEDCNKEKEYLESAVTDEDGNVTYTKEKYDAGEPKNLTVSDNLVISDKSNISLNPVGPWWSLDNNTYNTRYFGNLGIMRSSYQSAAHTEDIGHNSSGAMRYEIINDKYTSVMKKTNDTVSTGELYKVSAWIYADKLKGSATAQITIGNNPDYKQYSYPYIFDGNGETPLEYGEWKEIYCYWIANKNDNTVIISFPQVSIGDVLYIDDITFEKINAMESSAVKTLMYQDTKGEYKYLPEHYLDLSETKQTIKVGETSKVIANKIVDKSKDIDSDGVIRDTEMNISVVPESSLTYSSNDLAIATVTPDGIIKAEGAGMAIITAEDSEGNKASVTVSCYEGDFNAAYINDVRGSVKYIDPLYGEEITMGYNSGEHDIGYTAQDGMMLNFWYFDNGVKPDQDDNTITLGFTMPNLVAILWWESGQQGYVNAVPGGAKTSKKARAFGWYQVSCVMTEKDSDNVFVQWYYDGQKGHTQTVKKGTAINFAKQLRPARNPVYIKDLFVVCKGAEEKDLSQRNLVFDNFDDGMNGWTTDKINVLDKVYSGTKAEVIEDYDKWFEDFSKGNYRLTDYGTETLTNLMPGFKAIDFTAIGNTEFIGGELSEPILKFPVNAEKSGSKLSLYWSKVPGAATYTVKISKNSDMSDVIYSQTVKTNTADITLREAGTYYWTVTAHNSSKQYKSDVTGCIGEFTVESGLKFNSVTINSIDDDTNSVTFIYDISAEGLNGKAIIAEKNADGKIIKVSVQNNLSVTDGKLKIECMCNKSNYAECYIWNDLYAMQPLTAKQSSTAINEEIPRAN